MSGPVKSWKFKLNVVDSPHTEFSRFVLTVIKHFSSLHVTVMNICSMDATVTLLYIE